mgnify:CR=1 FL=1
MDENDLSRIENLKRKMYSRDTVGLKGMREHPLSERIEDVKQDWEGGMSSSHVVERKRGGVHYVLVGSFIFFVAALGYAGYLYFGGSNIVSSNNIDIAIAGPVSTRGGDPLILEIAVTNGNQTPLEVADLLVEYPTGTRDSKDLSKELPRTRVGLGTIKTGATVKKTVSAVLFGEEHSAEVIKITVEYRVPGSNAIFYKESEYEVVISSSPISLVVDAPKEATSGQDITFKITVNSNSTEVVKNVLLKVGYPAGFSFKSGSPEPLPGNQVWKLGDLKPQSSRTITLSGTLSGENLDTRAFHFDIGIASPSDDRVIATPFASYVDEVAIKKPFVGLQMLVDQKSVEILPIRSGRNVQIDITYVNNLTIPVNDIEIIASLTGSALDKSSVSTGNGFYRSVDNSIIWNGGTFGSLQSLAPGESGHVSFSLSSLSLSSGIASLTNPQIVLSASVKGRRGESGRVPQEIISSVTKTIQIESDIGLNTKLLYYSGPFKNTGGVPPKVDRETTYTIVWTVTNGSNDLSDAKITAILPPYVRFVKGDTKESVTFSEIGSVVTWNVGSLKAHTGFGSPPREAVFQVAFTPSVSQIGATPALVREATFSAVDRFTQSTLSTIKGELSTRLPSDSSAKFGDDTVVK